MLVMVGSTRSRRLVARIQHLGWGRVFLDRPAPYPGEPWALDNGAFAAWKSGKPFDADGFAARAWEFAPLRPRFGVLPDIVGEGARSLALSLSWVERLPASVPWYLAVQDGMSVDDVRAALPRVAGLFLGGTTEFKATAGVWCALAHAHGRLFHYARVSTDIHVRRAFDIGADSCDSTQPLWSREKWVKFERAVNDTRRQVALLGIAALVATLSACTTAAPPVSAPTLTCEAALSACTETVARAAHTLTAERRALDACEERAAERVTPWEPEPGTVEEPFTPAWAIVADGGVP